MPLAYELLYIVGNPDDTLQKSGNQKHLIQTMLHRNVSDVIFIDPG